MEGEVRNKKEDERRQQERRECMTEWSERKKGIREEVKGGKKGDKERKKAITAIKAGREGGRVEMNKREEE